MLFYPQLAQQFSACRIYRTFLVNRCNLLMNSDTLIWISLALVALSAALALIAVLMAHSASRRLTLVHQLVRTLQDDVGSVRRSLTDDLQSSRVDADNRGRDLRQELGGILQGGFARADEASRALWEEVLNRVKDGDESAKALREEVARQLQALSTTIVQSLVQGAESQRERLEGVTTEIRNLSQRNADAQEALKRTLEGRLDTLRQENTVKLEEMRQTVDEKLQSADLELKSKKVQIDRLLRT